MARGNATSDELVQACHAHLSRTHTVVWGETFNVYDAEEREEAVEWLAEQIRGVMGQMDRGDDVGQLDDGTTRTLPGWTE